MTTTRPDLGSFLYEEGGASTFRMTRVLFDSITRLERDPRRRFIYETSLAMERMYDVSFAMEGRMYDELLKQLPPEIRRRIAGDIEDAPDVPLVVPFGGEAFVGLTVRIGEIEPNEGAPFRPLHVLSVSVASEFLSIERIDELPGPEGEPETVLDLTHLDLSASQPAQPERRRHIHRPMPARRREISPAIVLTQEQVALLRYGFQPSNMDEKLSLYMIGDTLFLHRSWTGMCSFEAQLVHEHGRWRIPRAWANDDPSQCSPGHLAKPGLFEDWLHICLDMICSSFAEASMASITEGEPHAPVAITFLQKGREARARRLWKLLCNHGSVDRHGAVVALAEALKETGEVSFRKLPSTGAVYRAIEASLGEGVKLGLFDRPAKGEIRAIKPDPESYSAPEWLQAIEDTLRETDDGSVDAELLVEMAAQHLVQVFALRTDSKRARAHADLSLRGALQTGVASGALCRDAAGSISQSGTITD